jgi:P4 family phage/plasmid primase-like protien
MIKPMGKFQFNRQDIETFWDLYLEKIENDPNSVVGIAEKPQAFTPVLVDVDIKINYDDNTMYLDGQHLYTEEQVLTVIKTYQQVLREIVDDLTDEDMNCVLLEKDIYHIEKGGKKYTKNGFHLHFPSIFLSKEDQEQHLTPRVKHIIKELNLFINLGFDDSSKMIDSGGSTNYWLLYGSRKHEDMNPYLLTKVLDKDCQEIDLEKAFKHYKIYDNNEMRIHVRGNVNYFLPRILSINPYCRDNMSLKSNLILPSADSKPKAKVEVRRSEGKQYEKNYDKDMELASKLIPLLALYRSIDREPWRNVGFALHHISEGSDDGMELFLNFSEKDETSFDEAGCISFWKSQTYREDGFNLGSLRNWSKADNPEKYKELIDGINSTKIEHLLIEILYGSHSNVADFFKYVYGDNNIRVLNQDTSRMKFAHWNEAKKLWTIEKSVVLPRLLSTVVKPYVDEYSKKIQNQIATADEADQESFKARLKAIKKLSGNLCSMPFLKNVIIYYCSFDIDETFEGRLNSIPNELPCRNGKIIDLKTKQVRERTRDDIFSFELEVDYIQNCNYENVIRFFSAISKNDDDLVDYHKRLWGYSMTGEISDRSFHMLWGDGRNGKSTLMNIINKILGNKYFVACSDKVVMSKDNQSATSPEMIRLMGSRLAVLSETKKGDELNEVRIKALTGGDPIVARGLYQEEIQFKVQCTLVMLTNNKPIFDTQKANTDRIKLLPFLAEFENSPENQDYINDLITNHLDDFFSWFVDGASEWYNGKKLVPCKIMDYQMKSYINELDIQGQFVEERIEIISKETYEQTPKLQKCNKRIKKEALYGLFVSYAIEQGVRIKISKIDFHKGLSKHNIETITCQGFPFYLCSEKVFKADPDDTDL